MQDTPSIITETRGPVALIRLNRPDRLNALTLAMIGEIEKAVRKAEADEAIVGIVITGERRAFSAGLDAVELQRAAARGTSSEAAAKRGPGAPLPALFGYMPSISKPVIAAVNGVAAGGGFVLAMMCDLRFFAQEARVTTVFSKRGLIAEHGTSYLLPRMVGLSRSLDLLWSSRMVDADEAQRIGLADRVVPQAQLVAEAQAYIEKLAAEVSPRSLAVMKAQVYADLAKSFEASAWDTVDLIDGALSHPDATEGVLSFVERRAPRFAKWTGKKS